MTPDPVMLPATATVIEAARAMRDRDIGAVVVTKKGDIVCGMVTDRDIAVRAVAEDRELSSTMLGDICSRDLTSVPAETPIETAVEALRGKAIRRLPVMDSGRVVGIVSIGDLAVERDPGSVLGAISAAPPNH